MKLSFLVSLLFFTIQVGVICQPESGMPNEPGKCYAKCLIQDSYEFEGSLSEEDFVFKGTSIHLNEENQISLSVGVLGWIKTFDPDCIGNDLNDDNCYYWKLVEIESDKYIDVDDSIYDELERVPSKEKVLVREGGFTEWREVVCSGNVTTDLIRDLWHALNIAGYNPGSTNTEMSAGIKSALVKYQQDNYLPVGQLDFESLRALKVK